MHNESLIKAARGLVVMIFIMAAAGTAFAEPVTYTYDTTNRLIYANDNGTLIEYVYDKVGNLQQLMKRYIVTSNPSSKDFGGVNVGATSAAQTFTVTNAGTQSVTISTVGLTGTDASSFTMTANTCAGSTLAPSATCTLQATFSPSTMGNKSANISISFSSPAALTLSIPLSGIGLATQISVSPTALSFGNVAVTTTSAAQTVTISNSGTANLLIGTLSFAGSNAAEFQIVAPDPCSGHTVAPAGTCFVQVVLTPATAGAKNASLSIPSNDNASPTVTVSLSGAGTSYVRILRTQPAYFVTLQAAYNAAADSEVIQLQATTLVEDITFNRNISVTVDGGYDANFTSNGGGMTLIRGSIRTSAGSARMRNMRTVQ